MRVARRGAQVRFDTPKLWPKRAFKVVRAKRSRQKSSQGTCSNDPFGAKALSGVSYGRTVTLRPREKRV
jgi:hypothetical protein